MMFTDLHITRPCYALCEYPVIIVQYADFRLHTGQICYLDKEIIQILYECHSLKPRICSFGKVPECHRSQVIHSDRNYTVTAYTLGPEQNIGVNLM